jgi:hypothetical protein
VISTVMAETIKKRQQKGQANHKKQRKRTTEGTTEGATQGATQGNISADGENAPQETLQGLRGNRQRSTSSPAASESVWGPEAAEPLKKITAIEGLLTEIPGLDNRGCLKERPKERA